MIVIVAGARPNLIKIAPISKVFTEHKVPHKIWYSGQHYDKELYTVIKDQLGVKITTELALHSSGNVINDIQKIIVSFKAYIKKMKKVKAVLVVGDVNTTYACSLVVKSLKIPLIHVEAGLRSFDDSMPEEKNRLTVDHLSDILFASCQDAVNNLKNEGITKKVYLVGNVMIDCLNNCMNIIQKSTYKIPEEKYIVVTFHRPENVDNKEQLTEIIHQLELLAIQTYKIIFPMHPRTKHKLQEFNINTKHIEIIQPLGYIDFMKLLQTAALVITDSGGIQEELCYLNVPCFTLRKNTERPITIKLGTNLLTSITRVLDDISHTPRKVCTQTIPFWDGNTANRIYKILRKAKIC